MPKNNQQDKDTSERSSKSASNGVDPKFLKPYDPGETEGRIYKAWEESGYFNPDNLPGERSEPFTIVLPPPNVTGTLHVGHAYEDSLQDAIVRFERMRGKKALWIPGTDSAAIATQARVEKNIQKEEKKSRHDLGRDELVRRVSEFAKDSESTILNQVRKMGASLDWSRYAYTMDEKRYHAVMEAFIRMYDAGLIYRGNRIVNWDPKGQTTISDDEIVYEERDAHLYTFKYWKDFPIAISTTRPETKVGDTAVAVHPDDVRYKELVGQEFTGECAGKILTIRIVADAHVDMDFGTGALGVTPAHSMADWDIADRHNLPRPQVINEYAKMTEEAGPLVAGMKVLEAREQIVMWLQENGLIEKDEVVKQNVSTAERTGGIIEPLPKLQWWLAVDKPVAFPNGKTMTLKQWMREAVESSAVTFPQERFRKIYFNWIDNLRDWCLSRQIWFGHRIPVWYRGEEMRVQTTSPGDGWVQEEDVLDTWFSSALWTFSTLGWPEETDDLKLFHPTSFMSPAYEILPLWVSRMILMAGFHLGQVPFKTVLIHGLVRDKTGRKFSKSLGNGIEPLDIIKKYGADALRLGLLAGTAIGNDINFDEQKIKGYAHFANKLWNIARFVLDNADGPTAAPDGVLLDEFRALAQDVTSDLENYRYHLASEKMYHYVWDRFAAEILEESKTILRSEDEGQKAVRRAALLLILRDSLKLLHPFMPFVTEEIYQSLPTRDAEFLMIAPWPVR